MGRKREPVPETLELEDLRRRVAELEAEAAQTGKSGVPGPVADFLDSFAFPDIFYRLDPHGLIVFINNSVRAYGYEPSDLVGTSILEYVHPEDREAARFRLNERRTGKRATGMLEIRLFTPTGTVEFEYSSSPVTDSPVFSVSAEGLYASSPPCADSFLGTQGIARDITERKRAEKALRESEEKYRELAGSLPQTIFEADTAGNLRYVNQSAFVMFGYDPAEFEPGKYSTGQMIAPVDRDRARASIERLLSTGEAHPEEFLALRRDGSTFPALINSTRIMRKGIPDGFRGIIVDITRQKLTEEALRESEIKYRSIVEIIPDLIIKTNKDGKYLDIVAKDEFLFKPQKELLGKKIKSVLPKKEADILLECIRKSIETRLLQSVEYELPVPAGKLSFEARVFPSAENEAFALIRDITERKRAEEALRETNQRLLTVMNSLDSFIYIADIETYELLFVNEYGKKVWGLDIIGQPCWQVLQKDIKGPCPFCTNDKLLTGDGKPGGVYRWEFRNTFNGRWYECLDRVIQWVDGRLVRMEIATDITERKQAEEIIRLDEKRLESLLELNQMADSSEHDLTHFAMEAAVRLTNSSLGYIAFANEDETVLTIYAWSGEAMRECTVEQKPIVYQVSETGLWGEAVRRRRPIVTNDYAAPNPLKKGVPDGHVQVTRHMNAPIFDGDRIVIVAGVGNKPDDYGDDDVRQLTLLMSGLWSIIRRKRAEEALKASEASYRQIFEGSRDGFVMVDLDARVIDANRAYCDLTGYSLDELRNLDSFYQITPERWRDWEATEIWEKRLLKQGYSGVYEKEYIRKNGSVIPIELQAYAVGGPDGKVEYLWGIARDISERKRAEEKLRHSHDLMSYIIEHNRSAVAVLDRNLNYIYVSRRFLVDYNVAEKDIIGKHHYDVFPEIPQKVRDFHQRALSGEVSSAEDDPFVRQDGSVDWTRWECRPWYESDGSIGGIILYTEVITDRKRAEEKLKKSEETIRNLVDSSPYSIQLLDRDGYTIRTNEAFLKLFGANPPPGYTILDDPVLKRLGLQEEMFRVARGERVSIPELLYNPHEVDPELPDNPIWVRTESFPLLDQNGNVVNMVVMHEDVTKRKRAEEALRRSEEKYRAIIETNQEWIWQIDTEGTHVFSNPAIKQMLGYTIEEVVGRSAMIHMHPDDCREIESMLAKSIADKQGWSNHVSRWLHKDGSIRWLESNSVAVLGDNGELAGFQGSDRDITDRKRAEDELRESHEKYRNLVESLNEIVYALDDKACITYVSPNIETMGGYKPDELIGKQFTELVHPEDRQGRIEQFRKVLAGLGEPSEYRLLAKDGTAVWIRTNARVVRKDNRITGIQGTLVDITGRKKAEKELMESEEKFRGLFHKHSAVKLIIDPENGNIVEANEAAEKFYGWSAEELRRMRIQDINTLSAEEIETEMKNAVDQKRIYFEFRHRLADGSVRDVAVYRSGIEIEGKTLLHSIIHDITAHKLAEQEREKLQAQLNQAQKMESVGRLAGGVAHDFNNMLGVILGHAELAMDHVQTEEPVHANLLEIRKAAERSANLTRQLLAFARKQTISPRVLDLNETVKSMLDMLRRLIGEDIDLAWNPGKKLWPLKFDPSQIDQVLVNLCVNSRDAIAGTGKIIIETENGVLDEAACADHPEYVPGEYVRLSVSDNGCGMDKSTLEKLFEPFFTTKGIEKGTGLGLATVYGIVKQNNGFINVYSEPGQGTTFTIYLPRHGEKAERQEADGTASPEKRGHETILLVEDEPAILKLTTTMLERLGYSVLAASTPGEAIHLAERHSGGIHLLITDVVMPEMNGRDLANNLLSLYPGIGRLFMSGYTADVIAHHGVLDPGVHFIQKPFSMKDLAAGVREALGREGDKQA